MAKHTPGPWRYEEATKTIRSVPANYWLATMDSWDGAVNHQDNAHLIAAAPEMYEVLKRLEIQLAYAHAPDAEMQRVMHESALEAIAKAEGRL